MPKPSLGRVVLSREPWRVMANYTAFLLGTPPPKSAQFWAKNSHFSPKIASKPGQNAQTKGNGGYNHARFDFTVPKSPLVPFNSEKRPKKALKTPQKLRNMHQHPETKNGPYLGLRGSNPIPRASSPPQPPTFCGFQPSKSPNQPPRPLYKWSLGGAGGQPGPRTVGANGGSGRVPRAKKIIFSKVVRRPLGMLRQVFLARYELVMTLFGP